MAAGLNMGTRWKIDFQCVDPRAPDGGTWTIGVDESLLKALQQQGHHVKQSRLLLVADVVSRPLAIFGGWSRPGTHDCFVYAGQPNRDYRGPQIEVPAPPKMLFLVFVVPGGTIDDWNWRPVTPDNPDHPLGVGGKKLWPLK